MLRVAQTAPGALPGSSWTLFGHLSRGRIIFDNSSPDHFQSTCRRFSRAAEAPPRTVLTDSFSRYSENPCVRPSGTPQGEHPPALHQRRGPIRRAGGPWEAPGVGQLPGHFPRRSIRPRAARSHERGSLWLRRLRRTSVGARATVSQTRFWLRRGERTKLDVAPPIETPESCLEAQMSAQARRLVRPWALRAVRLFARRPTRGCGASCLARFASPLASPRRLLASPRHSPRLASRLATRPRPSTSLWALKEHSSGTALGAPTGAPLGRSFVPV